MGATTQGKSDAIADRVDSHLLEIRGKVVHAAELAGTPLKQTLVKEGKDLRPKA